VIGLRIAPTQEPFSQTPPCMQAIHTHAHTDLGFGLPEEFRPFTQRLELRAASKDSTTQHRRRSRNSTVHGSRSHKDSSCGPRLGNPTVGESRSHKDRDAGRGGCSRTHTHRHTRDAHGAPLHREPFTQRISVCSPDTGNSTTHGRRARKNPSYEPRLRIRRTKDAHRREPLTQRLDLRAAS
jgi:hypothetical protein